MSHTSQLVQLPQETEIDLPSGRTVAVDEANEIVEIRGSDGSLELHIELTEAGPVLRMNAIRMELAAEESVKVNAPKVEIQSSEGTRIASEGDVNVEGAMIWLN